MELAHAPQFLTYGELRSQCSRYTYKPGFDLSVFLHPYDGPVLRIRAEVPNSYRPDELTVLRINSPIPPMQTPEQFAEYLLWRLGLVESHESREWFKRDGKPLRDPHEPIEPA